MSYSLPYGYVGPAAPTLDATADLPQITDADAGAGALRVLIDGTTTPVTDARVELYDYAAYLGGSRSLLAGTTTDANGDWRRPLAAGEGRYALAISKAGLRDAVEHDTAVEFQAVVDAGGNVTITEGL